VSYHGLISGLEHLCLLGLELLTAPPPPPPCLGVGDAKLQEQVEHGRCPCVVDRCSIASWAALHHEFPGQITLKALLSARSTHILARLRALCLRFLVGQACSVPLAMLDTHALFAHTQTHNHLWKQQTQADIRRSRDAAVNFPAKSVVCGACVVCNNESCEGSRAYHRDTILQVSWAEGITRSIHQTHQGR